MVTQGLTQTAGLASWVVVLVALASLPKLVAVGLHDLDCRRWAQVGREAHHLACLKRWNAQRSVVYSTRDVVGPSKTLEGQCSPK